MVFELLARLLRLCSLFQTGMSTQAAGKIHLIVVPLIAMLAAVIAPATHAQAWTYNVIYNFCSWSLCSDGGYPQSTIGLDASGNLYGTAFFDGKYGAGTVYELKHGSEFRRLHSFCKNGYPCRDGEFPISTPIVDTAGNIYATASQGGKLRGGVVFELVNGAMRTFKVLHGFCVPEHGCPDGEEPSYGALTYRGAASGAPYDGVSPLYGTTQVGGSENFAGVVYALQPVNGKWKETVLYRFCVKAGCIDGSTPAEGLLVDAAGNLYGTTAMGGANNEGVVFKLSPKLSLKHKRWTETTLHSMCSETGCSDGRAPFAPLMIDEAGDLLGTAQYGGAYGGGVVFKLVPNGTDWTYSVLYDFCSQGGGCLDGYAPSGAIALDGSGNIFGTTTAGGTGDPDNGGAGVVYELTGGSLQVLYNFCQQDGCADGETPLGIVLAEDGKVLGAASVGGAKGGGAVFELSP